MNKAVQTLILAAAMTTVPAAAHGDNAGIERDYNEAVKAEQECRKAFGDDDWAAYTCREPAARAILIFGPHLTCHRAKEKIESCRGHPRR